LSCLLLAAIPEQQNTPEMTQQETAPTFESRVNLVIVPVVVRDAQGNAVTNLTKADFQIFDKGKPQTITSFTAQKRASSITVATGTPASRATTALMQESAPANSKATPPERFIAYVFDDLSINISDLVVLKKAAAAHLANRSSRLTVLLFTQPPAVTT
jgi:VWFA-related protein